MFVGMALGQRAGAGCPPGNVGLHEGRVEKPEKKAGRATFRDRHWCPARVTVNFPCLTPRIPISASEMRLIT